MSQITVSEKLKNQLRESFGFNKEDNTKVCRVEFEGRFIKTLSGKTVWRTKGYARAAIISHIKGLISYDDRESLGGAKEFVRKLEVLGLINYVEYQEGES